jgi:hypothetical protein
LDFLAFANAIEATLLAEHNVGLHRGASANGRIEWLIGAMTILLDAESPDSAALAATLFNASIAPVSYPITMRGARQVAHDLAALIDMPPVHSRPGDGAPSQV